MTDRVEEIRQRLRLGHYSSGGLGNTSDEAISFLLAKLDETRAQVNTTLQIARDQQTARAYAEGEQEKLQAENERLSGRPMTDTTEKLATALADWGSPWQGTGTAEEFCRLLAEQGLAVVPVEPPKEGRGEIPEHLR